jgi:hypothetical protein
VQKILILRQKQTINGKWKLLYVFYNCKAKAKIHTDQQKRQRERGEQSERVVKRKKQKQKKSIQKFPFIHNKDMACIEGI